MFRAAIATILCLSCANYAHADGAITRLITKSDQARLDKYEETRRRSMRRERAALQRMCRC